MRAVTWHGKQDMRVDTVPDPELVNPRDAIIRVTATAICGSDLHLYNHWIPSMQKGDILGHEFMGIVEEVGAEVKNLKAGDRVVVPFPIACGHCGYCRMGEFSSCDNSNPNAGLNEALNGFAGAGLYGYSHLYGGYAGGQAEYVRVPYADIGPIVIPEGLDDEQVLFLSDIFPTGYMAAENCDIVPGDVVAVWGAGPVGLMAAKSAYLLGAEKVIVIDRFPERLDLARDWAGAEILNYASDTDDVVESLKQLTGGRGPDSCIDAVGLEAHGTSIDAVIDRGKQKIRLQIDRANALRQVIQACGKGGTVSLAGVYAGFIDKFPMGVAFAKGLTFRMGQCHAQRYLKPLLDRIQRGEVMPEGIITHRATLEEAPELYRKFNDKVDGCVKCVMKPS